MSATTDKTIQHSPPRFASPRVQELNGAVATSRVALNAVYRLRYEVCVAERRKTNSGANHSDRMFSDDLDRVSRHFFVRSGTECIAAVRYTDGLCHRDRILHEARMTPSMFVSLKDHQISFMSRFVTACTERGASEWLVPLLTSVFEFGCEQGAVAGLIHARRPLVSFLAQLGYFSVSRRFFRDAAGSELHSMVVLFDDIERFRATGSPFYQTAVRFFESSRRAESIELDRRLGALTAKTTQHRQRQVA